jgi:UDP-sugar pyrophosphorylase
MDDDQITIVQQGEGVPALIDNQAHIALDPDDMYRVESKPHGRFLFNGLIPFHSLSSLFTINFIYSCLGHGDIHSLIYSSDVANKWLNKGIEWAIFFQDTNGLAFQTLPLSLGVSKKMGLIMNSMAVPRKAKQAIGGIAKLSKGDGQER